MRTPFPLSGFVIIRDADVVYTWTWFVVVKIRVSKIQEMRFYLNFGFLGFKVVKKQKMNLFKGSEDFGFLNFIWLD